MSPGPHPHKHRSLPSCTSSLIHSDYSQQLQQERDATLAPPGPGSTTCLALALATHPQNCARRRPRAGGAGRRGSQQTARPATGGAVRRLARHAAHRPALETPAGWPSPAGVCMYRGQTGGMWVQHQAAAGEQKGRWQAGAPTHPAHRASWQQRRSLGKPACLPAPARTHLLLALLGQAGTAPRRRRLRGDGTLVVLAGACIIGAAAAGCTRAGAPPRALVDQVDRGVIAVVLLPAGEARAEAGPSKGVGLQAAERQTGGSGARRSRRKVLGVVDRPLAALTSGWAG